MDRISVKLKIPAGLEKEEAGTTIADTLQLLVDMLRETNGDMLKGRMIADDVELDYVHLREVK